MKTRINLYLPELRTKRQYLCLSHFALAWGCLLGLLLLTGGIVQYLLQQTLHQQQTLQQQISALDAQTKTINAQLQQRHPDSSLERELKLQQEEIISKQQLKIHLNQIGVRQNEGFSVWLYDLAQARSPSIALQSFDIENNQLRLQGEAASNDAVPAWLSHFGDHPKLRDRTFSALQVQRQKSGALQFHLESKESAVSSATGTSP
jgi:Tfp pilus assembly protein PilN